MTRFLLTLALATVCAAPGAHAQEKIKIGYWSSGFSVGFGAVLEAGKFVEQQGLVPEYVHFADVNGPTKAILTQSIDATFGASTTAPLPSAFRARRSRSCSPPRSRKRPSSRRMARRSNRSPTSRARSSAFRRSAAPPTRSPPRFWKRISDSSPPTIRRWAATRPSSCHSCSAATSTPRRCGQ